MTVLQQFLRLRGLVSTWCDVRRCCGTRSAWISCPSVRDPRGVTEEQPAANPSSAQRALPSRPRSVHRVPTSLALLRDRMSIAILSGEYPRIVDSSCDYGVSTAQRPHDGRTRPGARHRQGSMHQKDELEQDENDDDRFQELASRHRRVLDGETVDVVHRLELLANVPLPLLESESGGGHGK